jgi:hypothetical protein
MDKQGAEILRYYRESTRGGATPFRYVVTADDLKRDFDLVTVQVRDTFHETDEYHVTVAGRIISSLRSCEGPVPLRFKQTLSPDQVIEIVRAARCSYKDEGYAFIRFARKEDLA